jgi:hypothetical protein
MNADCWESTTPDSSGGVTGFLQSKRQNPLPIEKVFTNQALMKDGWQKKSRHKLLRVGFRVGRRD